MGDGIPLGRIQERQRRNAAIAAASNDTAAADTAYADEQLVNESNARDCSSPLRSSIGTAHDSRVSRPGPRTSAVDRTLHDLRRQPGSSELLVIRSGCLPQILTPDGIAVAVGTILVRTVFFTAVHTGTTLIATGTVFKIDSTARFVLKNPSILW